jgi:DNA invertase Pin-like site-specific DNA recombinase
VTSATSGAICLSHPLSWDKLRAMNKPRKPVRTGTIRAIAYIRVSTRAQAESGAGLEHQRRECERYIQAQGWQLVEVIADEGATGTKAPDSRPGLGRALKMLDEGDADALVSLKVDRVSRSTLDFANLVKRSDDRGWQLCTLDVPLDPATPIGKAMRNMLATFAQLERDFISARTKEGLAIKMEQPDFQIGRPESADTEVISRIRALRTGGLSWPKIAATLNDDGVPTSQGKGSTWYPMTCKRLAESDRR